MKVAKKLKIAAGDSLEETLEIRQEASTNWYHPHVMGLTAIHVYEGLAGFFYIEDEKSDTLDLPKDYGVNDIPLVVQDRAFIDGVMKYTAMAGMGTGHSHASHVDRNANRYTSYNEDMLGNTILANGAINAVKVVPKEWVRLRLLNGANARRMSFAFSDKRDFYVIASDGGFLDAPVKLSTITLSTGERVELMVDFSDGKNTTLMTDDVQIEEDN